MSAFDDFRPHALNLQQWADHKRMLDEIDRLRLIEKGVDDLLPVCLTCNGAGMEPRNFSDTPCRDCSDGQTCGTGKVSIGKLVGLWTAATDPASDLHHTIVNMALDQYIAFRKAEPVHAPWGFAGEDPVEP